MTCVLFDIYVISERKVLKNVNFYNITPMPQRKAGFIKMSLGVAFLSRILVLLS